MGDIEVCQQDTVDHGAHRSIGYVDGEYQDKFMELAFGQAREALAAGEVPIGCVFVDDKEEVIAKGRNEVNLTKKCHKTCRNVCY